MAKYRNKPNMFDEIEAITFNELIEYGKNNGGNIEYGMPWSFTYKGCPVTHEHNECYLILTQGVIYRFTPQDMLITSGDDEIYLCTKDLFNMLYEPEKSKMEKAGK